MSKATPHGLLTALEALGVQTLSLNAPEEITDNERWYMLGALNATVDMLTSEEMTEDQDEDEAVDTWMRRGYVHTVGAATAGTDPLSLTGLDKRASANGWSLFATRLALLVGIADAMYETAIDDAARMPETDKVTAVLFVASTIAAVGCRDRYIAPMPAEDRTRAFADAHDALMVALYGGGNE